ncbi:MAG: diguanylate cyclase [Thermodesulfobacteriota bacterium]
MSEAYPNSGDNIQFKNVLAVDNDPIMLKFLSRILKKAGLNVVTAKDGVTAIDIIESYTPDLFFIDLVMPNIDGRELCRIIRSKKTFKTSPIVIVSAIAAEESINTAEIGANVCIAKVAYSEMEKTINKLLIDPELIWNPKLGNRVLGIDDLSPRNITNELLTVNRHYRFMLDSISSGIIEFDNNRRVIYANPAALRIFSMQPEVMLGSHVDQLFNAETNEPIFSLIHSSQPEGVLSDHHVKISIDRCILDICVAPSDYSQDTHVIIMEDITIRETTQEKLIEANNKLEILARVDSLTEVFNRRHFDEALHQEWGRLKREKGGLSLILCDVDYFKSYNDTYGHLEGDKCLRNIAQALNSKIQRPSDIVARYGGDEFVVLLPNTILEGAQHLAEQIRNLVCQLQIRHEKSPIENHVTVTIGAGSGFPDDTFPEDKFIWLADKALYEAKIKGRNCIVGKTLRRS